MPRRDTLPLRIACWSSLFDSSEELSMTKSNFTRRDFLTGVAGTALSYAIDAPAQTPAGPRPNITVRIAQDLAVLDPASRTGPWEGNVIRVVFQRLMKQKPNSA